MPKINQNALKVPEALRMLNFNFCLTVFIYISIIFFRENRATVLCHVKCDSKRIDSRTKKVLVMLTVHGLITFPT